VVGGVIRITTTDSEHGYLLRGACYSAVEVAPGAGFAPFEDRKCSDADGVATFVGVPTGSVHIELESAPFGYFLDPISFNVDVVAGQTTNADVELEHWPLLIVSVVDQSGAPLGQACFEGYTDLGGGQHGPKWSGTGDWCDTDGNGELWAWVTPGNSVLVEVESPFGYLPIEEMPITMIRGQLTRATVVNAQAGTLTVNKFDDGTPRKALTSACFALFRNVGGNRGEEVERRCDRVSATDPYNSSDDGKTVFNGLVPGSYLLGETVAPNGYYLHADIPVTITSGNSSVDVADEHWPLLDVTVEDDEGTALRGGCFTLYRYDNGEKGANAGVGACVSSTTSVARLTAPDGLYLLDQWQAVSGYVTTADVIVRLVRGEDQPITVVNPAAGFVGITNLNEDGLPVKGGCWELWTHIFGSLDQKVDDGCVTRTDGTMTLSHRAGSYVLRQKTPATNYAASPDQIVSLARRQTTAVTVVSTLHPKVVIMLSTTSGDPVTSSCYDIHAAMPDGSAGDRLRRDICDDEAPTTPGDPSEDGMTTVYLAPGRYVVRQTKLLAEFAFVTDTLVTVAEGQTEVTVTLTAELAATILLTTRNRAGTALTGACYEVWTVKPEGGRDIMVRKACDKETSQTGSTLDGAVKLERLPPGDYIVVESFAPAGYSRVNDFPVTVGPGETLRQDVTNDLQ
jgi:uncharacterized surface anchored protein